MPRPVWSGTVSFGLVTIPVKMFNAVSRKSVSFNQLDDRTMARIKYRKVSAEDGQEVPDDHIVKGYEVSKDHYIVVDPDELEQFMPSATHALELDEFVDLAELDPLLFDSGYYLAPDKAPKPYVLLARAMEAAGKVGVGRMVMRNKQYLAAVRAVDGQLLLSTMVYADEVVKPSSIDEMKAVDGVEVSDKELAMAGQLVASLAGSFDLSRYKDSYREQVMDLIEKKAAGEELTMPERPSSSPAVIDLMAALEASVKAAKDARTRHPSTGEEKPARKVASATKRKSA